MDLPTYTSIWKIEKRLYKLYDFRLPMPLPLVQIAVFVGVLVAWIGLLRLVGVPLRPPWHVLYLAPPLLVTWLATRPVIENKKLAELLLSQVRYLTEPRTWCRLAPVREPTDIVIVARIWRRTRHESRESRAVTPAATADRTGPDASPEPRIVSQAPVASARPESGRTPPGAGHPAAPAVPAEPVTIEPVTIEPVTIEPVTIEPVTIEPVTSARPDKSETSADPAAPAEPAKQAPPSGPTAVRPAVPPAVPPAAALRGTPARRDRDTGGPGRSSRPPSVPPSGTPSGPLSSPPSGQGPPATSPRPGSPRGAGERPRVARPGPRAMSRGNAQPPGPVPPSPAAPGRGAAPPPGPTGRSPGSIGADPTDDQERSRPRDRAQPRPGRRAGTSGEAADQAVATISAAFTGSRRIVVLGCAGGAGQTVTALMLGHTLARHRSDRCVALDLNPGLGSLAGRSRLETPETLTSLLALADAVNGYLTMRGYTSQARSRLEVLASDDQQTLLQSLGDHDYAAATALLDRYYKVTIVDPAATVVARVLPFADQLVLVAPASADAPRAVEMTFHWLDEHHYRDLRADAVTVVNGVSRRSLGDAGRTERVAARGCRAVVRVPWDDHLSFESGKPTEPDRLRPAARGAYLRFARAVAAHFPAVPPRYHQEVNADG